MNYSRPLLYRLTESTLGCRLLWHLEDCNLCESSMFAVQLSQRAFSVMCAPRTKHLSKWSCWRETPRQMDTSANGRTGCSSERQSFCKVPAPAIDDSRPTSASIVSDQRLWLCGPYGPRTYRMVATRTGV